MKAGWYVSTHFTPGQTVRSSQTPSRVAHHYGEGYTVPVCGRKVTTNTVRDLRRTRVGDSFCMACDRALRPSG